MNRIEIGNVENIMCDGDALLKLFKSCVGDNLGDFVFVLPEGSSELSRTMFDNFINNMNFEFKRVSKDIRIHRTEIKVPAPVVEPVIDVIPEVVPEPEPEVVPEPEPEVVPETEVTPTQTPKRKR
jgi:hypothetical protein